MTTFDQAYDQPERVCELTHMYELLQYYSNLWMYGSKSSRPNFQNLNEFVWL